MQEISYRELINKDEIQRLQDEFCAACGVLAYCLDESGAEFTGVSGEQATEVVQQYHASGYVREVLERVEEGSLEDLAVVEADSIGGEVAAVAIRAESGTVLYWVVIRTGEGGENVSFEQILDLLRDASYTLIESKVACFNAEMESKRSITTKEEIDRDLKAIEASTEVLQLLDSEEPIERIMAQILRVLGNYLQADTAQVFQLRDGDEVMDVLSEWLSGGYASRFKKGSGIEAVEFLKTTKPLVLTLDGPMGEYHSDLIRLGLQAVMVFPILRQENNNSFVLSLNCRDRRPAWGMPEVKFASDAVRVMQSILTKRIQKNSIAGSRIALEAILDNVGTAIYVTDIETDERLYANDKLQRQFVMELQDGSFPELLREAMEKPAVGVGNRVHEFYHADVEKWYNVVYREMAWVDGRRANLYVLQDITESKEYEKKLELQSQTDYLTGLYNRTCMEQELEKCIEEATRTATKGALLYMDLDDFKHINDGLGHQYGDEVLKSVSDGLQKIDGIQKTCYRMGGDEFVIIVPPRYFGRLEKIKQEILKIFAKPWYLKDANHTCTMSMGIVTYPDSGNDVTELFKKVDLAVYDAKRSGKNRIVTYENGEDISSGRRWKMEQSMRAAIADNFSEFRIVYQPIMEVTAVSNNCVGAEALLRWNNKDLGEVELSEFLPLAEHLGLINSIGNYVLHTACKDCRQWNDNGVPDFKVTVNLSAVQLLQTDIVEIVDETVRATGIRPDNLILDVKEDMAVSDKERMAEIMDGFRSLGVQVALDDFGTGLSSMNHIRELPFDMVKIGQEFTGELSGDAYVQAFVQMVDHVDTALHVYTCVEGVETVSEIETLRLLRVRFAQGHVFGTPAAREDFEEKFIQSVDFI